MPVYAFRSSTTKLLPQTIAACLCLGLAMPVSAQSGAPAAADPPASAGALQAQADGAAPTILVVGQRPGPGLWKVTKGDHVMWVFGTYSPLPKKMEWRSHEVEAKLAQSQEYIGPPGVSIGVGFFGGLGMLPQLVGIRKNPGNAPLRDVVPADVYARWLPLKAKYIGDDDDVESYRPLFAADELMQKGLEQVGMSKGLDVRKDIERLASKADIKMTKTMLSIAMREPSRVLKAFKQAPLDEAACFARTVEWFEGDIDAMRQRANAWATGDIDALRQLDFAKREEACRNVVFNSTLVQSEPQFKAMEARAYEAWLAAVEKALSTNASTFAVLDLEDILDPAGPLAALRAKGYDITSPE